MAESISNLTGLLPQLVTVQGVQYDAALTIALPGVVPNISVRRPCCVALSPFSGRHWSGALLRVMPAAVCMLQADTKTPRA